MKNAIKAKYYECRNILHIVLATDNDYAEFATICITSLLANNKGNDIHIHLLNNNVSQSIIESLHSLVFNKGGILSVYPIGNIRTLLHTDVPNTISVTSYARLFIGSLLPQDINRVLYIDCDVIFNDSIVSLFNIDLKDSLVCGVIDPVLSNAYKKRIGIPVNEPYINAGVLLIALDKWRSENLESLFIEYLVRHNGKVHLQDQGIVNAVCIGRKQIISPRYNAISNYFCYPWKSLSKINSPFYHQAEFNMASQSPIIIHFTETIFNRPWIEGCTHPYVRLFLQYKAATVYKNSPLRPNRQLLAHRMEKFLYQHFPFCIFKSYIQFIEELRYIKQSFVCPIPFLK